ncbi:hypothetical protein AJ79_03411 [Helicocarpus griseus UAMH5409]|uniref:Uncharacterized protein n=1 Tax=Helicocarpus griseus UAMH5409 TaxID=1447875 RepID=A0A2B7XYI5_9EURO|nr:hypothetical protein AJ79_03411 [Helicocarpus griseus UAMH5409]
MAHSTTSDDSSTLEGDQNPEVPANYKDILVFSLTGSQYHRLRNVCGTSRAGRWILDGSNVRLCIKEDTSPSEPTSSFETPTPAPRPFAPATYRGRSVAPSADFYDVSVAEEQEEMAEESRDEDEHDIEKSDTGDEEYQNTEETGDEYDSGNESELMSENHYTEEYEDVRYCDLSWDGSDNGNTKVLQYMDEELDEEADENMDENVGRAGNMEEDDENEFEEEDRDLHEDMNTNPSAFDLDVGADNDADNSPTLKTPEKSLPACKRCVNHLLQDWKPVSCIKAEDEYPARCTACSAAGKRRCRAVPASARNSAESLLNVVGILYEAFGPGHEEDRITYAKGFKEVCGLINMAWENYEAGLKEAGGKGERGGPHFES